MGIFWGGEAQFSPQFSPFHGFGPPRPQQEVAASTPQGRPFGVIVQEPGNGAGAIPEGFLEEVCAYAYAGLG